MLLIRKTFSDIWLEDTTGNFILFAGEVVGAPLRGNMQKTDISRQVSDVGIESHIGQLIDKIEEFSHVLRCHPQRRADCDQGLITTWLDRIAEIFHDFCMAVKICGRLAETYRRRSWHTKGHILAKSKAIDHSERKLAEVIANSLFYWLRRQEKCFVLPRSQWFFWLDKYDLILGLGDVLRTLRLLTVDETTKALLWVETIQKGTAPMINITSSDPFVFTREQLEEILHRQNEPMDGNSPSHDLRYLCYYIFRKLMGSSLQPELTSRRRKLRRNIRFKSLKVRQRRARTVCVI